MAGLPADLAAPATLARRSCPAGSRSADLLIDRVRYLRQRDDLDAGRRRAQAIETAWTAMLAAEPDPEVARSLRKQLFRLRFNLANILRDLGQFEDSRAAG